MWSNLNYYELTSLAFSGAMSTAVMFFMFGSDLKKFDSNLGNLNGGE